MEEAEAEDEASIGFRRLTVKQHAVIAFHHRSQDIGSQSFGWFIGHFHAVLEQQGWELYRWHGRQPESVVVVGVVRIHLLTNSLQLWQPTDRQMAVAKQHPSLASFTLSHCNMAPVHG